MDYRTILKVILTAIIVVAVLEISKRSRFIAAIIISLPLTSILALSWLYIDQPEKEPVASLSMNIFWAVIPSLAFFPIFALLLRSSQFSYPICLLFACVATAGIYYLYYFVLRLCNVSI